MARTMSTINKVLADLKRGAITGRVVLDIC